MAYQLQEINKRIRSDVKEFLAECDRVYSERVSLAADRILSNLGDPDGYAYDRITAVKSMKHCYVIYIDKKKSIPVLRDGFTRGDFESFKAFLKTKRPDLKIPK